MSEWQPIETAPKDRTPIWARWNDGDVEIQVAVEWRESRIHRNLFGWHLRPFDKGLGLELVTRPTHWMHLPEPPAKDPHP